MSLDCPWLENLVGKKNRANCTAGCSLVLLMPGDQETQLKLTWCSDCRGAARHLLLLRRQLTSTITAWTPDVWPVAWPGCNRDSATYSEVRIGRATLDMDTALDSQPDIPARHAPWQAAPERSTAGQDLPKATVVSIQSCRTICVATLEAKPGIKSAASGTSPPEQATPWRPPCPLCLNRLIFWASHPGAA